MFSNTKISVKLMGGFFLATILPAILTASLSLHMARTSLTEVRLEKLESIIRLKKEKMETFFMQLNNDILTIQKYQNIENNLPILTAYANNTSHPKYREAKTSLDEQLKKWSEIRGEISDFLLTDSTGTIVYATNDWHAEDHLGNHLPDPDGLAFAEGRNNVYFTDIFRTPFTTNAFGMLVTAPLYDSNHAFIGVIALEIDMNPIYEFIQNDTGLGDSGETLIAKNKGDHALFLSPLLHDDNAVLTRTASYNKADALPIQEATQGKAGVGIAMDYRANRVFAAWIPLELPSPNLQWGMVTKIDFEEAMAPVFSIERAIILSTSILIVIIVILAYIFAQSISRPILTLHNAALQIAQGNLDTELKITRSDEIGELSQSFNIMSQKLKTAQNTIKTNTKKLEDALRKTEEHNTSLSLSQDATLNILEDLHQEKKKTEKALQDAQKFELAVNSSNESIVISNTKGIIEYVNPAFTKLTGYSNEEAIGQNPRILKSGETPREVYDTMWSLLSKGEIFESDELINKRKDGTEYYADIAIYPVMDGNTPQFFVAVQRDVTQRKKEDRAKTEFVSIASHQLRTPLTAIRWALGRFRKKATDSLDADSQELLNAAVNGAKRMGETINAMLNMSRIAAGKLKVEEEKIHLCEALEEIRKEIEPLYIEKHIHFSLQCSDGWTVTTDPKLLKEIIGNLLTNAIKYTPEDGEVSVNVGKDDWSVTIKITDTGYGIPKEQQNKIFTKFFRADNILDKEPDGNGLGLYLVKELTLLLGGTITFDSIPDKGTTFTITLLLSPSVS